MRFYKFTGIAAFAILCLARASAVTIVQTGQVSGFDAAGGTSHAGYVSDWAYNQFAPISEPLGAVRLEVIISYVITGYDVNPYPFPVSSAPLISLWTGLQLQNGPTDFYSTTVFSTVPAFPMLISPGDSYHFNYQATQVFTHIFSGADLLPFQGIGTNSLRLSSSTTTETAFGDSNMFSVANITLSYNTPEGGNSAALSAIAIGLVILIHWRRRA